MIRVYMTPTLFREYPSTMLADAFAFAQAHGYEYEVFDDEVSIDEAAQLLESEQPNNVTLGPADDP